MKEIFRSKCAVTNLSENMLWRNISCLIIIIIIIIIVVVILKDYKSRKDKSVINWFVENIQLYLL